MNLTPMNKNVQPTMSSIELCEYINTERDLNNEGLLRHDNLMAKIPKVLGDVAPSFEGTSHYMNGAGHTVARRIYNLPKREACLVAMSYSYNLQAKVYDRMTELEQHVAEPALPDFSNPVIAARAWADAKESEQKALAAAEAAKPALEFVNKYVGASSGNKGFRQVCKLLRANERHFRDFLSDHGVMYLLGGEWMPYQKHIDAGRFVVNTGVNEEGNHAFNQAKFTPKGISWIAAEWAVANLGGESA